MDAALRRRIELALRRCVGRMGRHLREERREKDEVVAKAEHKSAHALALKQGAAPPAAPTHAPTEVREHTHHLAVELCGRHITTSPAMIRSSNGTAPTHAPA